MSTRPLKLAAFVLAAFVPFGWSQEQPQEETPTAVITAAPEETPAPAAEEAVEAEPAPAPAPVPPSADPTTSEVIIKDDDANRPPIVSRSSGSYATDTLSVDFPEEDIRNILRNVADLFELNLVIPDTLQGGRTSIKLRDVTWRQIFEVVLEPVGYTYVEDANIIKIVSQASLAQEPVSTEVFLINYARAADIMPTIQSLVDTTVGGRIVIDSRTNSLVITERPSRMNRIRPIIEKLDRATDQVMIESKFVEATDRDVKNVGINWASLQNYTIGAGPFSQAYERESGHQHTSSRGERDIDVPFMRDGYERADSLASRNNPLINPNDPNRGIGPKFDPETGEYEDFGPTSSDTRSFTNNLSRLSTAVFNADQFRVVLSALQNQNATKVVSNPTIVTLNNSEAVINVGEERPIPNYTFSEQTGTFQISGFVYKPIGVLLRVTPQVNSLGLIKLTVSPEVSQPNGQVTFGGASGTTIPIVATRKATTQVSLKDGHTMAIGGLLTENGERGETKVPVLGSIPGVGRLFRSKSHDLNTTNLIIFITAKAVNAEGAPVEELFSSRQVRQLNMTREELPGYRDGSDPFISTEVAENEGEKK